jgi:hypothetical protein
MKRKMTTRNEYVTQERTWWGGWRDTGRKFRSAAHAKRAAKIANDRKKRQVEARRKKTQKAFAGLGKAIASTIKRTGRGLKRGVGFAWKMAKTAGRSVRNVKNAISRSTHQSSPAKRAQQRKESIAKEATRRVESNSAFRGRDSEGKPVMEWNDWIQQSESERDRFNTAEQLARKTQRETPTTVKVRQHDRQGTDGVTAHDRKLTGKQRDQATRDLILGQSSRPTVDQRAEQAKTTPTGRSAINLDTPASDSPTCHLRKFSSYQVKKS